MKDLRSVSSIKEYGTVRLKLSEYMDRRGISRNHLSRLINTRFEVVDKWYKNNVANMDLDILARICYVLQCDIEDILEIVSPDKDSGE